MFKFEKLIFGDLGWGDEFLFATLMTITVSILSMGLGLCLAIITVSAKLITNKITRFIANFYTLESPSVTKIFYFVYNRSENDYIFNRSRIQLNIEPPKYYKCLTTG